MIATILIGSTGFLLVACLVSATLLKSRPAQRYAFLCACFGGLLLLPVVALIAGNLGVASLRLPVYGPNTVVDHGRMKPAQESEVSFKPPVAEPAAVVEGPADLRPHGPLALGRRNRIWFRGAIFLRPR